MPIYEYRCNDCRRLTSIFVRSPDAAVQPACEQCGSKAVERALSRFAYHKSQQRILEEYGDPAFDSAGTETELHDPRQIGRWVENKFDEYGMEVPKEARDMIDAAREGEFPEPVRDL